MTGAELVAGHAVIPSERDGSVLISLEERDRTTAKDLGLHGSGKECEASTQSFNTLSVLHWWSIISGHIVEDGGAASVWSKSAICCLSWYFTKRQWLAKRKCTCYLVCI